jgi:hypothetical protein
MSRTRRLGLVGGLAAVAVAATSFACLWALQARDAEPPPANVLLDIAIWTAVLGAPAMLAAWLLRWRFAAGCARTALFPPRASGAAVSVTGALAAAVLTGAALPAGRVFALVFVGLLGGWRPWRWLGRAGSAGPRRARRSPGWRWRG